MPAQFIIGGKPAVVAEGRRRHGDVHVCGSQSRVPPQRGPHRARLSLAPRHYLSKWHKKYNPDADKLAKSEGYNSWVDAFLPTPTARPWTARSIPICPLRSLGADREGPFRQPVLQPESLLFQSRHGGQPAALHRQTGAHADLGHGSGEAERAVWQLDYADKFAIADLPVLRSGEGAGKYTTMLYAADLGAIRKYQFNLTSTIPRCGPSSTISASDRRCLWP